MPERNADVFQFPSMKLVYCECGRTSAQETAGVKLTKIRCWLCPPQVGDGARRAVRKFGPALEDLGGGEVAGV